MHVTKEMLVGCHNMFIDINAQIILNNVLAIIGISSIWLLLDSWYAGISTMGYLAVATIYRALTTRKRTKRILRKAYLEKFLKPLRE